MIYHKGQYVPTVNERRLINRESLFFPCRCSRGNDHYILPSKREGLGAGSKMWFHGHSEPYIFPAQPNKDQPPKLEESK